MTKQDSEYKGVGNSSTGNSSTPLEICQRLFGVESLTNFQHPCMVNIGENILESSEINFMNFDPLVFDVNHVAKIRSELSITVLKKKIQNYRLENSDLS